MAYIQKPDYETATAVCDHCGFRCVFNRIADIGHPGPYDGRYVSCFGCGEEFWICGDIINPAYDLFISSAEEAFRAKRYMLCVASLAQAWELFFSAFAYSNYLYHPYFESASLPRNLERANRLSVQLHDAMRKFTFAPLRNVLINTVLKRLHPQTLQEGEVAISRITDEGFGNDASDADVENFPDAKIRDLLKGIKHLRIGELRNKVVHHGAHRPQRAEVEKSLRDETTLMREAKRALRVYGFDEHSVVRARRRIQ